MQFSHDRSEPGLYSIKKIFFLHREETVNNDWIKAALSSLPQLHPIYSPDLVNSHLNMFTPIILFSKGPSEDPSAQKEPGDSR